MPAVRLRTFPSPRPEVALDERGDEADLDEEAEHHLSEEALDQHRHEHAIETMSIMDSAVTSSDCVVSRVN
jgi:hypothetical protein